MLAGGRSSRMGRDKALLPWRGRPLLAHMQALLHSAGAQEVLVSGDRPGHPGIVDTQPDLGPLGGLASVIAQLSDATTLVVVPVDMPLLSMPLLERLLAAAPQRCVTFDAQMLPMRLCIDAGVRESLAALMAGGFRPLAARLATIAAVSSRGCHRQRTRRVRQLQYVRAVEPAHP